jgi:hypothetical protein
MNSSRTTNKSLKGSLLIKLKKKVGRKNSESLDLLENFIILLSIFEVPHPVRQSLPNNLENEFLLITVRDGIVGSL